MRDLWDRLERWITENVPEWLEQLNPGASEEEIAKAERELGVRFPEDFRESLKIHNGEKPGGIGIIEGFWELLSIERMLKERNSLLEFASSLEDNEIEFDTLGPVKGDVFNGKWIPILSNHCRDFYLLDLDPAEGGTKGQIIYQFHDDLFRSVEACSFREWMELYVTDLENGKYRVTRDQEGWPQMERTDDEW